MKITGLLILISSFILTCLTFYSCDKNNNISDNLPLQVEDTTVVQIHGLLQQNGNKIIDKNNEPVSFAGNSFFWSNDNWGKSIYIGLATLSHDNSQLTAVTYNNIHLSN